MGSAADTSGRTVLHVVIPETASVKGDEPGGFTGLAVAGAASADDRVMVIGSARAARDLATLLGRAVGYTPIPRVRTRASVGRMIRRSAVACDAGAVAVWVGDALPCVGPIAVDAAEFPDAAKLDFAPLPDAAEARVKLGIGDETVIVPLTDRPDLVDARTLMFVTGVLELIGERLALVLPASARRLGEAMSYHTGAGLTSPIRLVDGDWICGLPAADVFVEPIDAGDGFSAGVGRALAARLGVPIAVTAAWHLDPDTATNSLPAEIRATVGPVLKKVRAVRTDDAVIA